MADGQYVPTRRRLIWVCPDDLRGGLYATAALKMAQALRDAGWQVDLVTSGFEGTRDVQGVEVAGIPRRDWFLIKQGLYHVPLMRRVWQRWSRTDVVFFEAMSTPWMLLLRIAGLPRRGRRPLFVMDIRTMPMETRSLRDRGRGAFTDWMTRVARWSADGQTAITSRMADVYHIPASKLLGIWPSGVDLAQFVPAATQRKWPQDGDRIELIYLGSLAPGRHLAPLCEAVQMARAERMDFRLTLMGDGSDRERLAAIAADSGGDIRLLDPVPHDQVPRSARRHARRDSSISRRRGVSGVQPHQAVRIHGSRHARLRHPHRLPHRRAWRPALRILG